VNKIEFEGKEIVIDSLFKELIPMVKLSALCENDKYYMINMLLAIPEYRINSYVNKHYTIAANKK